MHLSQPVSLSLLSLLSTTLAANHDITVGPALVFTPNTTTAAAGDTLTFHFNPSQHDITESEFGKPCDYKTGGFYSGSGSLAPAGNDVFVVTVNDTQPIYFYCSVPEHCQAGMVGGVNVPTSGDTLASYASAAAKTSDSTTPKAIAGGVTKPEGEASASSSSAAASSSSASAAGASSKPSSAASGTSSPVASSGTAAAAAASPTSTGTAASLRDGNAGVVFGVVALVGAAVAGMV
ncbi:Cupredoxin [Mytilinidion resinicola]|uniref:Cupredoxin n=1 Tax=Mytilinidion resinicola TaxID=574789 RepID=A0A6A6ZA11_9PEZI|nr:Cupredoxin [Mytilinidion resinicola]KAF2817115.1 Cupredoxin [Mytilinidion resinicola]